MMAKRFLLTGDPVEADEAVRLGLAAGSFPVDDVVAESVTFAQRLADLPPLAVQYTKQAVNAWIKATALPAFEHASALEIVTFNSEDHVEAVAAMTEKRPADFKGR
jgi:enoyl-CoA hydratase